jgi:endonuclease YncB( thermonuclease family)
LNHPARIVVLAFCGLCLIIGIWAGGRSIIEAQNAASAKIGSSQPESFPGRSGQRTPPALEHKEVRRIAEGAKGGSMVSSDLERLPPRTPLGQSSAKASTKPSPKSAGTESATAAVAPTERKETVLYQPVATAAGVLDAAGYHINLADIDPVAKDETCPRSGGGAWPCGLVARTAFRAWLRGRAMTCNVPAAKGAVITSCTVGDDDPALWLVENGWARSDDPRYRDAVDKAKDGKRGMFGGPPKAYSSMPALPPPALPEAGGDGSEQTP